MFVAGRFKFKSVVMAAQIPFIMVPHIQSPLTVFTAINYLRTCAPNRYRKLLAYQAISHAIRFGWQSFFKQDRITVAGIQHVLFRLIAFSSAGMQALLIAFDFPYSTALACKLDTFQARITALLWFLRLPNDHQLQSQSALPARVSAKPKQ